MLLSTHALVDLDSFKQQIGDNLHGANVIYIKASLKDSQHKMQKHEKKKRATKKSKKYP